MALSGIICVSGAAPRRFQASPNQQHPKVLFVLWVGNNTKWTVKVEVFYLWWTKICLSLSLPSTFFYISLPLIISWVKSNSVVWENWLSWDFFFFLLLLLFGFHSGVCLFMFILHTVYFVMSTVCPFDYINRWTQPPVCKISAKDRYTHSLTHTVEFKFMSFFCPPIKDEQKLKKHLPTIITGLDFWSKRKTINRPWRRDDKNSHKAVGGAKVQWQGVVGRYWVKLPRLQTLYTSGITRTSKRGILQMSQKFKSVLILETTLRF